MKLRLARKILARAADCWERGEPAPYPAGKLSIACDRVERTRTSRRSREWFDELVRSMGVGGRADFLARTGAPGMAFGLLMRTPMEEWR